MGFSFNFTTIQDMRQLRETIDFLHTQNLGYKGYDNWLQRTEAELISGYKQAILAYSGRKVVGDAIYQPHKGVSSLLELKNLRVDESVRDRKFGGFIVRQVEAESQGKYAGIICDVREEQREIVSFMHNQNFRQVGIIPLYEGEKRDVVMVKFLEQPKDGIIQPVTRNIESHFGFSIPNN